MRCAARGEVMRPHARVAAVLCLVALVACRGQERGATRLGSDAPIAVAIDRIVDFFSTRSLEHDELWFVHQGSLRLGGPFPTWARALRASDPPIGGEIALAAARELAIADRAPLGPAPKLAPAPGPPLPDGHHATLRAIAQLLDAAVSCSSGDPSTVERLRSMTGVRTRGYLLCHQAWALAVGGSRGCLDPAMVDRRRAAMARQLRAELLASDAITDLDIERVAVLCLIGACHWVPDAWFEQLLARQQRNGSWGDVTPEGVPAGSLREEHAVALAFYALARRWELERD